jgi:hypothetical protein
LESFDSPNDIYEDHEALDETELKQFKKWLIKSEVNDSV